jgi:phage host-nuclease inhibitor protein Gam
MTVNGQNWDALVPPGEQEEDLPTLGKYLNSADNPVAEDGTIQATLRDEDGAEWATRMCGFYEIEAAKIDERADRYIAQVNAYRRMAKARYEQKVGFFTWLLAEFFRRWRGAHPREKSLPLIHGVIGEHAQQPEVKRDEPALVEWMEKNGLGDLVKTEKTANWAALKKLCGLDKDHPVFLPTGEQIEAVTLSHRPPSFYVKPSEQTISLTAADFAALPEPEGEATNEQA